MTATVARQYWGKPPR